MAEDIIKELRVSPRSNFKTWRDKCYDARIFLLIAKSYAQQRPFEEEYKGFAMADKYAPFVFINSNYRETVQLFTLVHELAHLWINKSGMSNYEEDVKGYDSAEVFCNKVSANVLMPAEDFSENTFNTYEDIGAVAKKFKVSKLSAIYRARNLGLIDKRKLHVLKERYKEAYQKKNQEASSEEKISGGNSYATDAKRWSKLYAEIVWNAYEARVIQPTEAIRLLGSGKLAGWRNKIEQWKLENK